MGNLSDMFTYGVGIDTLYNVINKEDASFGFFLGLKSRVTLGGNTTGAFWKLKALISTLPIALIRRFSSSFLI